MRVILDISHLDPDKLPKELSINCLLYLSKKIDVVKDFDLAAKIVQSRRRFLPTPFSKSNLLEIPKHLHKEILQQYPLFITNERDFNELINIDDVLFISRGDFPGDQTRKLISEDLESTLSNTHISFHDLDGQFILVNPRKIVLEQGNAVPPLSTFRRLESLPLFPYFTSLFTATEINNLPDPRSFYFQFELKDRFSLAKERKLSDEEEHFLNLCTTNSFLFHLSSDRGITPVSKILAESGWTTMNESKIKSILIKNIWEIWNKNFIFMGILSSGKYCFRERHSDIIIALNLFEFPCENDLSQLKEIIQEQQPVFEYTKENLITLPMFIHMRFIKSDKMPKFISEALSPTLESEDERSFIYFLKKDVKEDSTLIYVPGYESLALRFLEKHRTKICQRVDMKEEDFDNVLLAIHLSDEPWTYFKKFREVCPDKKINFIQDDIL